ncbi:hypothetical protein predicted [Sorangium cellulosum So ce56]|uniref:Uncharacterized protein n=1 Tax=Sorangium cellulosum (strain So ce56) TaxID=448385 RepID=A9GJ69_SORC5|nr:hypothetical protein [Sorangium cellulosum]CAN93363.1 hypothetical protein predicted [Sorangium cellulosum So ce56]
MSTQLEARERIYRNLFGEPADEARVAELKEALLGFSPSTRGSESRAIEVLRALNGGEDPPFDLSQLAALQKVFIPPRPMSPVQADDGAALAARRYWHALVFGGVDQVRDLWKRLHDFAAVRTNENRARVVELLVIMIPGSTWGDDQLDALVTISVRETAYRSLAWWDTVHDAW